MVKRQEVEEILEAALRITGAPDVDNDTLAALCRAWLAVDGAPVRMVGSTYNLSVSVAGTGISNGQRVRIVKEPVE